MAWHSKWHQKRLKEDASIMHILCFVSVILINILFSLSALSLSADSTSSSQPKINPECDNIDSAKNVEVKLKNISVSVHHLQKTIQEIIFEITRQEYIRASEPEVVGPIVIPAIPPPAGEIAVSGFLPPRKKYINFYSKQAQDLFMMLDEEASLLPDNLDINKNPYFQFSKIKQDLNNMRAENNMLLKSMTSPKCDNLTIGKQAIRMSDDLDQLQKSLKECEKKHSLKN
jgi:hypothetical protein